MELFTLAKKMTDKLCHPKFLLLRDQLFIERKVLSEWADGMEDRDGKFVREFQETFHSAFWEIIIYRLLINAGYSLNQTHPMPDFYINEPKIFIEAVTANITGEKAEQIKADIEKYEEQHRDVSVKGNVSNLRTLAYGNLRSPIDQFKKMLPPYLNMDFHKNLVYSIVRYSSAISSKLKKYNDTYIKKEWVDSNDPFIIAMASFDELTYGNEYIYPLIALLYGRIYNPFLNIYYPQDKVQKTESLAIDIGLFNKPEYEQISAIMFSCTSTLGKLLANGISNGLPSLNKVVTFHEDMSKCNNINGMVFPRFIKKEVSNKQPEELPEGIFIFHNPNAKNPLPPSFLKNVCVTHIYFEDGRIAFSGNGSPIVFRYNCSSPLYDCIKPSIIELLALYNRMPVDDLYEVYTEEE